MKVNNNYHQTTTYNYNINECEFVYCYKSRPFAVLSSSLLPTPSSSYIDHRLVQELGIRMTDVGCKKISFAGKKLRMLGKVSFTSQCVQEGNICGNFHFKASVIEDLKYHFDTHGVVGVKMKSLLSGGKDDDDASSSSSSPGTPTPTRSSPSSTPSRTSQSSPSFPGVPDPKYLPDSPPVASSKTNAGPRMANIIILNNMFGGADIKDDVNEEREVLSNYDEGGTEDTTQDQFTFITTSDNTYNSGHGRSKCRFDVCSINWEVPDNCGFAGDTWSFPNKFRPCSKGCRGAFCQCINDYNCG